MIPLYYICTHSEHPTYLNSKTSSISPYFPPPWDLNSAFNKSSGKSKCTFYSDQFWSWFGLQRQSSHSQRMNLVVSEINRYHSNGRKWRGTKEPFDKGKKESQKAALKLNIQKTEIMASGSITSWQIGGEKMETMTDFFWAPKSL